MRRRDLLLGSAALLTGCGGRLRRFPFSTGAGSGDGLAITYFSVGCFLLEWRGLAVLTDPFFSHLSFVDVAIGAIASDPEQVDPYLHQLGAVQAVLVGHSHYDHVLDLPYIASSLQPGADVFGSQTLVHTLAPLALPLAFHPVNQLAATPEHSGQWQVSAGGRVRVLPIASGHPNNYAFIHLWTDRLTEDRATEPTRAADYQEGETFAFLVDFLDDAEIVHRVYVETSSRGYPDGFFPPEILAERPVDVALLAMDCANIEARGHDSIIDFLQPPTVIFCHWERFFRRKDRSPREITKVNLPQLYRWFEDDARFEYRFPAWDSRHVFPDP